MSNGESAKEYLSRYEYLLMCEKRLKDQYKAIMSIDDISAIDYEEPRVQTSTGNSMIETILIRREKARDKYNMSIIERVECLNAITDITLSMNNPIYSSLIYKRYVQLEPWYEISEELGYSLDHTRTRLHSKALEQVQKILDNQIT